MLNVQASQLSLNTDELDGKEMVRIKTIRLYARIRLFYSSRVSGQINSHRTKLNAVYSIGVNVT
jgi:hypothetical protein